MINPSPTGGRRRAMSETTKRNKLPTKEG